VLFRSRALEEALVTNVYTVGGMARAHALADYLLAADAALAAQCSAGTELRALRLSDVDPIRPGFTADA